MKKEIDKLNIKIALDTNILLDLESLVNTEMFHEMKAGTYDRENYIEMLNGNRDETKCFELVKARLSYGNKCDIKGLDHFEYVFKLYGEFEKGLRFVVTPKVFKELYSKSPRIERLLSRFGLYVNTTPEFEELVEKLSQIYIDFGLFDDSEKDHADAIIMAEASLLNLEYFVTRNKLHFVYNNKKYGNTYIDDMVKEVTRSFALENGFTQDSRFKPTTPISSKHFFKLYNEIQHKEREPLVEGVEVIPYYKYLERKNAGRPSNSYKDQKVKRDTERRDAKRSSKNNSSYLCDYDFDDDAFDISSVRGLDKYL